MACCTERNRLFVLCIFDFIAAQAAPIIFGLLLWLENISGRWMPTAAAMRPEKENSAYVGQIIE